MKPVPPRWATRLLQCYCDDSLLEEVEGDLHELFLRQVHNRGLRQARLSYAWSVIRSIRLAAIRRKPIPSSPFIPLDMLRNYILTAFRNLLRNRTVSFINLFGLAVGLTISLLIGLYIRDELSYDAFHSKADRLVLFRQFEGRSGSGSGFAPFLQSQLSQVEKTARLTKARPLISLLNQVYYEPNFYFADSAVFSLLDFPLVQGHPHRALAEPNSLVISEKMARKYFPNQNPLGRTLRYDGKQRLTVTAVMKNLPANSHLTIDFLANFLKAPELMGQKLDGYWDGMSLTYLLLSPNTSVAELAAQLPALVGKTKDPNGGVWKPALIPLRDIYLQAKLDEGVRAPEAMENVYVFGSIAAFILALACFNYINLVSARTSLRAKEIGVRKVMGARRGQLLTQFLGESALVVTLAALVAVAMAWHLLPRFNGLAGKEFSPASLVSPPNLVFLFALMLGVSLLTGSYPALVLSSFRPVNVLKSAFFQPRRTAVLRRALVVVQFTVSIVMGIATLVLLEQLHFIHHMDLGYQHEQVLTLTFQGDIPVESKNGFKQQIQALSAVRSVTLCSLLPGQGSFSNKLVAEFVPPGKPTGFRFLHVDADFIGAFGIKLIEGRNFTPGGSANKHAFIVNRTALKYLEWGESGVGRPIGYYTYEYSPDGSYQEVPVVGEVIGVVDNYHQADLKQLIEPMMFSLNEGWEGQMGVHLQADNPQSAISAIEQRWKSFFPGKPFEYGFLDEAFEHTYRKEERAGRILGLFAALAIFISCLGLFGLSAFAAERRSREVGIRKVLGASVTSIVALLAQDFLKLVLLANLIAWPLAWWAMNRWLEDFAYRITMGWWTFALVGASALAIALLAMSFQAVKAAIANPVKSLRRE